MNDVSLKILPLDDQADKHDLYHYTSSGLDNYWLSGDLYEKGWVDGEEIIRFPQFDDVQAAIGMHICELHRLLGPREIRFLRGELNFSQRELGQALGYADKQIVLRAESRSKSYKPLIAAADMLLRHHYLGMLGAHQLVGDAYRAAAIQMSAAIATPVPVVDQTDHVVAA